MIKLDRDGLPFIRVDCPLDVTTLQSNSILIRSNLRLKQSNSVSALKDQANAEFKAGRFRRAIWLAKEALLEGTNPVVILNLIAYYLAIGFTVNADVQATLLLESPTRSDLSPSQVDKLYWRAAVAKYRNGQYKECIGLLNAAKINSHDQSGQQLELQAQAHLRLVEQKGQYDLPKLYKDMVEGSLTLGEYTNAEIAVQNIPGKGRGIVATSALAPGTLLMVARPIACSQQTQITAKLQALDLTTESISSEAHSSLPDLILARVKDDPSLWPRIRTLYAGPSFETTDREQPVDVGFVECACAYNAFKPESIANTPSSQETTSPGSALYSLPSMVNHACSGNAVYCFYGDYYALRTITKINPGQEITASYVDPCLPYEERARKLKHHTKACDCRLCAEDRLDDPKARHKRDSLIASAGIDVASQLDKAVVSGSASPSLVKKVRVYVEALEHTYGHNLTPRRMYRPQMYAAYRMLSRAIDVSSESKDINALMLAEVKGLECLGLVVDYKTFAKEGLAYPKFLDTPWPILLNQSKTSISFPYFARLIITHARFCSIGDACWQSFEANRSCCRSMRAVRLSSFCKHL